MLGSATRPASLLWVGVAEHVPIEVLLASTCIDVHIMIFTAVTWRYLLVDRPYDQPVRVLLDHPCDQDRHRRACPAPDSPLWAIASILGSPVRPASLVWGGTEVHASVELLQISMCYSPRIFFTVRNQMPCVISQASLWARASKSALALHCQTQWLLASRPCWEFSS